MPVPGSALGDEMNDSSGELRNGLSGASRLIIALMVLALAVLGILVVFEIVPRETLVNTSTKIFMAGGIFLAASLAIGMLSRR